MGGAVILNPGIMPDRWRVDPGLVAQKWRWFHNHLLAGGIMWDRAGPSTDVVDGNPLGADGTGMSWVKLAEGGALHFDKTANAIVDIDRPRLEELSIPHTLIWYGILESANTPFLFTTQDWNERGSTVTGAVLILDNDAGILDCVSAFGDGGAEAAANRRSFRWTNVLELDVLHLYAVTHTGDTTAFCYNDGIDQGAPATEGAGGAIATSSVYNGRLGNTRGANEVPGDLVMWAVINALVSPEQHLQLALDPFGPFRMMAEDIDVLVTVQIAFPFADVSLGGWTPSVAGSPTELWPMIDEATADDSDFIQSILTPTNDTSEVRLQSLSDPGISTGHIVHYRYSKDPNAGRVDLTVKLMQGVTEIASFTHTDIPVAFTQANQTLSAAQADSISDYGDLRLRFTANQP